MTPEDEEFEAIAKRQARIQRAEEAFESAKKHEWVGLTDEEIWAEGADNVIDLAFARDIEAKLKEKNT
jgi:hypothetical protein